MSLKNDVSNTFLTIRGLMIHAVSRIVPPKDVEDIVQEAYVKVCLAEKKETINYPKSYLFKTAQNLALDYVKSSGFRTTDTVDSMEIEALLSNDLDSDTTYGKVAAQEEFGQFCEVVRMLPSQCRRAFVFKKVYGYSQKEIAGLMGISEKTVEKHIAYGIKRCTLLLLNMTGEVNKGGAEKGRKGGGKL